MCGIFAVSNAPQAASITHLGLFALQHRGQESAGIVTLDNSEMHAHRGAGLVSDVFDKETLSSLVGSGAVGHVRYSTAGGLEPENTQPLSIKTNKLRVALAHNGNIVNAGEIRERLEASGAVLQGSADTELILHLIARSKAQLFEDRIRDAVSLLVGSFALVLLTPTHLYAVVDAKGFRPLALGKLELENGQTSYVVASESCAFDLIGAEFVRDVAPGELVTIDRLTGEKQSSMLFRSERHQSPERARCSFEHIYFARPDSRLWNETSLVKREELGASLAMEWPVEADAVIAVPDSGVPMAMGYARASGIAYEQGFIRNHYVGRTFIEPTQNARNFRVKLKLNPVRDVIRGKRIIVVDDSIVRGTTSRKIVELLRDAGAREVHLRVGSPPVRFSCYYGIDTPEREDLLAQKMTLAEMSDFLQVDSLGFLSNDALRRILGKGFCQSCFTGNYPDSFAQKLGNPRNEATQLRREHEVTV